MDKKQKEVIVYSKQIMHFLEELVGGANHEINNLLFIIGMSSELLETSDNAKERQEAIKNIENLTKRIGQVLKDLRSVIKDCGTEEVKLTKLSEVSSHVIELCKTRFNNHKIIFKNNVPDDLFIEARETQMTQALLAVLNSCHDAVIQGNLKTRWINFDVKTENDTLNIFISDSGPKIDQVESSKIFSPSFDSNGRKGLPLIIAKNIIESHGGEIEYSKDSDMNTFVIKFNKYKKAEAMALVSEETTKSYLKAV